ncbi:putative nucleotidyltransferase [uncultured Desulfobacterium sp.]|uniref:Putative nucleotidyltransferase n=1 Tax=uncultured Desulfobacterium sp. TaxID=201089 RepID=A0A445N1W0_9BACT|nr:putative nucleotidyltransferase [uncultured Desulfobacterium sp.]
MNTHQVLAVLKEYRNQVAEKYGLQEIGIFGSLARNEATEMSDVDVVIRVRKPDLFLLAGIKIDLEERLNRPVDIVTYSETMNLFLKKRIDKEAVYA